MIGWNRVDTVLLDMDGTLLDLHFDNFFWRQYLPQVYAAQQGLSIEDAHKILFARFEAMHGTLEWYCLDYWSRELRIDIAGLKLHVRHLIQVRPGARAFLRFLHQEAKRTILVTNAHPKSLALKMQQTGIGGLINHLISAHDLGFPKEEGKFWSTLAQQTGIDPSMALFIDDTEAILDTAKAFGVGYVSGIYLPDSLGEPRVGGKHPLLRDFAELMPGHMATGLASNTHSR